MLCRSMADPFLNSHRHAVGWVWQIDWGGARVWARQTSLLRPWHQTRRAAARRSLIAGPMLNSDKGSIRISPFYPWEETSGGQALSLQATRLGSFYRSLPTRKVLKLRNMRTLPFAVVSRAPKIAYPSFTSRAAIAALMAQVWGKVLWLHVL